MANVAHDFTMYINKMKKKYKFSLLTDKRQGKNPLNDE